MGDTSIPIEQILKKVQTLIDGINDRDAKLLDICALLDESIEHYDWVGFYIRDGEKEELLLGPFVGEPTEHVRIPFGKGICGQAAQTKETFVVQDTSKETNYLSCSPNVRSEIVIPLMKGEKVIGELDIDSHAEAPFTEADTELLEDVCNMVSKLF